MEVRAFEYALVMQAFRDELYSLQPDKAGTLPLARCDLGRAWALSESRSEVEKHRCDNVRTLSRCISTNSSGKRLQAPSFIPATSEVF